MRKESSYGKLRREQVQSEKSKEIWKNIHRLMDELVENPNKYTTIECEEQIDKLQNELFSNVEEIMENTEIEGDDDFGTVRNWIEDRWIDLSIMVKANRVLSIVLLLALCFGTGYLINWFI